ncbi:MAG: copper chaperone PCu(A)C [Anaerolineales bacterium]|nr:MAG: copper chaperone PCu(A)C [Anaerolineales bacterium]
MKKQYFVVLVLLATALAACSNAGGRWHTHEAFSRPTLAGGTGAAYFMLHNATDTDDALIGASSDVAETVEIHLSGMVGEAEAAGGQAADHEHGEHEGEHGHDEGEHEHPMDEAEMHDMGSIGTMVKVERVELAAGHEIAFEPGGYHIMLINLQRELVAGDTFELTLHFEHAEDMTIEVKVVAP